jgi:hypothetical protein
LALRRNDWAGTKLPYEYPINLKITENALEFQFRGFKQNEYQECLVLRVPLDLSMHPDLSINPIISRKDIGFDIGEEYSFVAEFDNIATFRESVTFERSDSQYRRSLFIKIITFGKSGALTEQDEKTKNRMRIFHHLLLDFLYDFIHSDVFSIIPNYEHIKELIYKDVFLYALISKCEFHYLRNEFSAKCEGRSEKNPEARLLAKLLCSAEQKWLSIIHDNRFGKVFSIDSIWFENIETEYLNVLSLNADKTNDSDTNSSGPKTSSEESVSLNTRKKNNSDIKRRKWIELLIEKNSEKDLKKYSHYNKEILSASAKWYTSRYMFRSALNCIKMPPQDNTKNNILTLIKLSTRFLSLILLFFLIIASQKNLKDATPIVTICYWIVGGILGLLPAVIGRITCFWIMRNLSSDMLTIFMPRLIVSLASYWIVFLTSNTLRAFIYTKIDCSLWFFFIIAGIVGCILLIINLDHQIPNYKVGRKCGYLILFKRVLGLIVITCIYSLVIGLVLTSILSTMITSELNDAGAQLEVIAIPLPIGEMIVFPRILLIIAFSTVFFGAFIELLLHSKPLADAYTPSDIFSRDI